MKRMNNYIYYCIASSLLACTIFINSGCFDFEANHMVAKFKVLALQTEPPEIAPGEGFEMEVLYADPKGSGREVSFAWFMCVNPVAPTAPVHPATGLNMCMLVQPPQVETASNDGHIFVAEQTPEGIMDYYPQELLTGSGAVPIDAQIVYVTAVVVACAGGQLPDSAALWDSMNVSDPSTLCQGGEGRTTYKVLRVTPPENPSPNENPSIASISINKQAIALSSETGDISPDPHVFSCNAGEKCKVKVDISLGLTPTSQQAYHTKAEDGFTSVNEVLYITWFTTGGEFEKDRIIADNPIGPYEAKWTGTEPGIYTLWAVAHDVRGGVSWESFQIQITPAI